MGVHLNLHHDWRSLVSRRDGLFEALLRRISEDKENAQERFVCNSLIDPALAHIPDDAVLWASHQELRYSHFLSVKDGSYGPRDLRVIIRNEHSHGPGTALSQQRVQVLGACLSEVHAHFHEVWEGRAELDSGGGNRRDEPRFILPLRKALEPAEKEAVRLALIANGWNRQKTAAALGINRTTLFNKMRKYELLGSGKSDEK